MCSFGTRNNFDVCVGDITVESCVFNGVDTLFVSNQHTFFSVVCMRLIHHLENLPLHGKFCGMFLARTLYDLYFVDSNTAEKMQ